MINHLGSHATQLLLHLFNQSLATGRLPKFWKEAIIQSIPKPGSDTYRPISFLSCLSKTMEKAVLNRLRFLIPHQHQYTYAYCKGIGTRDNLAAIHSLTDGKDAVIVFIDLEKASELANREAVISILAKRGVWQFTGLV